MNEASVRIGYGAGRGGLEPVWALWIREKFGHTGCTPLALLKELSIACINMEELMSHTRARKEQIDFIEAIPLCDNISFLYVPSYTIIYIKITQSRVTV